MNELYHHGILGMKWGVRRYQNPDGSLTPAGMKRYYKDGQLTEKGRQFNRKQTIAYNKYNDSAALALKNDEKVKETYDRYMKTSGAMLDSYNAEERKYAAGKAYKGLSAAEAARKAQQKVANSKEAKDFVAAKKAFQESVAAVANNLQGAEKKIYGLPQARINMNAVTPEQISYGQAFVNRTMNAAAEISFMQAERRRKGYADT